MNKTTNYQLNQWDAADQVKRVDFNADNAKIDAALAGLDGKAATAPVVLARNTLSQANNTITVSGLTGLGQYDVLRLLAWAQAQTEMQEARCFLRANGRSGSSDYAWRENNTGSSMTMDGIGLSSCAPQSKGLTLYDTSLYSVGSKIVTYTIGRNAADGGAYGSTTAGSILFCGFSGLSSLSLTLGREGTGPYPLAVGTKVILLGYKF